MEPAGLAAEALASGHTDLGVKGLEMLSGDSSTAEGQAVLEQAMLARTDDLAEAAASMLAERRGFVAVAGKALEAARERLRRTAVAWLAQTTTRTPPPAACCARRCPPGIPKSARRPRSHSRVGKTRPPSTRWPTCSAKSQQGRRIVKALVEPRRPPQPRRPARPPGKRPRRHGPARRADQGRGRLPAAGDRRPPARAGRERKEVARPRLQRRARDQRLRPARR